jgi:glucose-1-phosphate thymidylyltransferase
VKGLILSGGRGTRLRPLTHTRAKQLVPIANKANLDYAVDDLVRAGITDIGVVISPETGDEVRRHLETSSFGAGVRFTFILQDHPGGLAHAVKIARDYLQNDPFVMYLGDNLLDGGISHLLEPYRAGGVDACILLTRVPNPSSFGVAVKDADGRIVRLVEKPKEFLSDLALVGVYLFTPRIHQIISDLKPSPRGELEITEAIQQLLQSGGNVHAEEVRGYWKDTGKPDDLLDANRLVLSRLRANVRGTVENSEIVGEVEIQPGAVVRNSRLRGPISIAAHALIEDSYIGPYTSIGEHARVIGSEVEYSILMRGSRLETLAKRLDSSILGEDAEVIGEPHKRNTVQFFLGDKSSVKL